jgi:rhamnogalacturonan endolyase
MKKKAFITLLAVLIFSLQPQALKRKMEYPDRGLVAVKTGNGVFLSWRISGNEKTTSFNIYKNGVLSKYVSAAEAANWIDAAGTSTDKYVVKAVVDGIEEETGSEETTPWAQQYLTIQLNRPPAGKTPPNVEHNGTSSGTAVNYPDGQDYTYTPNDCSAADLDGDGEYEIIVKWEPGNSKDNSQTGITGNVYIDAYKQNGTQLWRIDLGRNIRAGAHYTQFLAYDFDSDGYAEFVCRTAPGTIDGTGKYVVLGNDDPQADYRNLNLATTGSTRTGFILNGPEYLTLFDGKTGAEVHSVAFSPARGTVSSWGDGYGNRVDRFLACVAYLDGEHPSVVMCRGYYAKSCLTAYDVREKELIQRWAYDSGTSSGSGNISGQGNHNLSVADVDDDGKDEIIYGSSAIDDDGKMLYRTGLGHGDAMHVSKLDPDLPGYQVWEVHEESAAYKVYGYEMHDAATGAIIWGTPTSGDNGRGLAADIDPNHRGFEMWSTGGTGIYNCKGVQISAKRPSVNFRIYWDGDLQDELLDGTKITKWNTASGSTSNLLAPSGLNSCNGSKATPNLSADILGDWREEVIWYETADPSKIRIYTTVIPTDYRLYTLMHDPVYRLGIAWQNVAYNQPPHPGFYIGDGLNDIPWPDIHMVNGQTSISMKKELMRNIDVYAGKNRIYVKSDEIIRSIQIYNTIGTLLYQVDKIYDTAYEVQWPCRKKQALIVKIIAGQQSGIFKIIY